MSPYNHKKMLQEETHEKYPIEVGGKVLALSSSQIAHLIKKKLKGSRVVHNIFKEFGVSVDQLDELQIVVEPLQGRFAETDATTMKISPEIVKDVLTTNFFIILHEICGHYTSRKSEERGTFFDPEEIFGMIAGCAGMMEQGYDFDTIFNKMWPKIGFHFHDENDGREMMKRVFERAKKMVEQ